MRRLRTLRVRFALWTAGLLLGALLLFGVFVYSNMSYSLVTAVDETLRLTAVQLKAETEVRRGSLVLVENPIEEPQYAPLREAGLSVLLLDMSGEILQEYGPYLALPRLNPAILTPNHQGEYTTTSDPATGALLRVFTSPVFDDDGQPVGALQVVQGLKSVSDTLNLLMLTLLLAGPLIVLGASVGGYLLAGRALAPIDEVTRTARRISGSDLSTRLHLPATDDEVGRLVATFDSMLERLDAAFRRERQFTADASHELRTPLAAMQAIIGGTLSRRRSPEEYEQALTDLDHETGQMRTLTEGLLHLARDDAARTTNRFEHVDLTLLLRDVADSLSPLADEKQLELITDIPQTGLEMMGDSDDLIRLFVNVLDNAIKYTDVGSVSLTAHAKNGNTLVVTIRDTGLGVAPEHAARIFDRFYRVDESRSKAGSGLGLAIAQSIARAHGGTITVESTVGVGTTFVTSLSTNMAHGSQAGAASGERASEAEA